jgi:hypothetical protein
MIGIHTCNGLYLQPKYGYTIAGQYKTSLAVAWHCIKHIMLFYVNYSSFDFYKSPEYFFI